MDTDISASKKPIIFQRLGEYFGRDNVLQTLALKTLTAKSAIITACRGLGINDDTAHTLAQYVPVERGTSWTLKECFEGNPEKDRKPIPAFIGAVEEFSSLNLKETILQLEGLINGRSIHASSVYVYENGFLKQNAMMRAPNGTPITAFNMHDSDIMGGLKLDLLVVKALDKMQQAMELLVDASVIEDQGSLKATYDKYFHPDVLEYEAPEMWQMLHTGELIDAFQMDSLVGAVALKKIKPSNVVELASASSLMRLMAPKGEESPIDVYVRYKEDITNWYDDMKAAGLSQAEMDVLKKHLLPVYGVAETQEAMMLLSMDPKISNFSVAEANLLRKSVAKKRPDLIEKAHDLFYEKGKEQGTSLPMLNYVWDVLIKRQLGYGFSSLHATAYAIVCLQQMNLAYRYRPLYWNTACLTVNAGANDIDSGEVTDYGKIGTAINSIISKGQKVVPPYINRAKFEFFPDAETNEIVFSLKALRGLGDAQAACIVENQPFTSFKDFLEKTQEVVKPASVIALIKAGAFDRLESLPREKLLAHYAETQATTVSKLGVQHLPLLQSLGKYNPEDYRKENIGLQYVQFCKNREPAIKGATPGKTWYYVRSEDDTETYFEDEVAGMLKADKDYMRHDDGYLIVKGTALNRVRDKFLERIKKEVIENPESLKAVNGERITTYMQEKCPGNPASWEMETMSFYVHPHELTDVDKQFYQIQDFCCMPEEPVKIPHGQYSSYQLFNIMGTVISRNKSKRIVTLLTPSGIVNVRLSQGDFVRYDKQLSEIDADGKKTVIDKSWFSHGNKLIIRGYRRGDSFSVRSNDKEAIQLITEVGENGVLQTEKQRAGGE